MMGGPGYTIKCELENNSLRFNWHTGWNIRGDYTYAKLEGYGYHKQVYAKSGASGTYSDWVGVQELNVSHKDYGPYKTDDYSASCSYHK